MTLILTILLSFATNLARKANLGLEIYFNFLPWKLIMKLEKAAGQESIKL